MKVFLVIATLLLTTFVQAQALISIPDTSDIIWQGKPDNSSIQVVIKQNPDMGYTITFDTEAYHFPFSSKVDYPVRTVRNSSGEITDYYTHFSYKGSTLAVLLKYSNNNFIITDWEFNARRGLIKN